VMRSALMLVRQCLSCQFDWCLTPAADAADVLVAAASVVET